MNIDEFFSYETNDLDHKTAIYLAMMLRTISQHPGFCILKSIDFVNPYDFDIPDGWQEVESLKSVSPYIYDVPFHIWSEQIKYIADGADDHDDAMNIFVNYRNDNWPNLLEAASGTDEEMAELEHYFNHPDLTD